MVLSANNLILDFVFLTTSYIYTILQFRILNGRIRGDMQGRITRYPRNYKENASVIDYSLCSTDLLSEIHSFTVLPFTGLSDHCCISVNIKTKQNFVENNLTTNQDNETMIHTQTFKYAFGQDKTHLYEQNLSNDENIDRLLISLRQEEVSVEDINKSVGYLNDILTAAANVSY